MSFAERPGENLGEGIEDLFCPTADSSGSARSKWNGFRMKHEMFSWGWGCVGEKACLRCVKLDVKSIRGKRTCMKTASVLTFFAVRPETGDRSCWRIAILNRSSLRSFRFGIITTTFSMVWHTALRHARTTTRVLGDSIHLMKASAWNLQRQPEP